MNFHLFKKKNTFKDVPLSDLKNTFEEKFSQRLPVPASFIKINYTLVCSHGRNGENFAAKLAEEGNFVYYMKTPDKNYMIKGTTKLLNNANEDTVREILSKIVEDGMKYNCILTEWEYILNK